MHRAASLYRKVISNNEAEQKVLVCLHYLLSGLTDFKDRIQVNKKSTEAFGGMLAWQLTAQVEAMLRNLLL